ncbi:alpha/beta fold hydrolase [Pelagibacterium xiamenense]|uniref:alpha/beta fold hydrolase n=1 Tax=Pelagibacterium xiamenense TaxID=2901140 RepID=UPI001E468793|nr:alpha/beta hydrolase [Pelagibacterium xiamenense]
MNIHAQLPSARFHTIEANPVPKGGRAGIFTAADGVKLRYGLFPRVGDVHKGTICLVQGRAEFIEKYFETITDFQKRGFAVATFDLRGQGGSERLARNRSAGHVEDFEDYWTDLRSFHGQILLPDCPPPYFLVGHSTGGLVALLAAARDRIMFDRAFLCSPMIGLDGLPIRMKWARRVLDAARFLGFGRMPFGRREDRAMSAETFEGNPLTGDRARYMRGADTLAAHPELVVGAPTISWIAAAMAAMEEANAFDFPASLKIPVFIAAAACDRVVSTAATEMLGLRMRTGHHVVIPGARHEMFMETDAIRAQLFAAFDAFVTEQSE